MLENGFIKLHRSLLSWEWYDDPNTKILFLHLLLTVNYEDKQWHGMTIKRGQRVCSLRKLAKETGLSVQKIRTCISKLKATGEITSEGHAQNTVLSIVGYYKFQSINTQPNTAPTDEQQGTNNNERKHKNIKKAKNKDMCAFEEFWKLYPKKRSRGDAENAFAKIAPTDELAAAICGAVAKAKNSEDWKKEGGKYIPHPATWLNRKGWEDEYASEGALGAGYYDAGLSLW